MPGKLGHRNAAASRDPVGTATVVSIHLSILFKRLGLHTIPNVVELISLNTFTQHDQTYNLTVYAAMG